MLSRLCGISALFLPFAALLLSALLACSPLFAYADELQAGQVNDSAALSAGSSSVTVSVEPLKIEGFENVDLVQIIGDFAAVQLFDSVLLCMVLGALVFICFKPGRSA